MALLKKEFSTSAFRDAQHHRIRYCEGEPGSSSERVYSYCKWKDYCPEVFRRIQEFSNIHHIDYMMSVRSDETIREIYSAEKDVSAIPVFTDNRLVIRTLQKSEVKVIKNMLPSYYSHLENNHASLLCLLYGLHYVKSSSGHKVYFAVYSNVIPTDVNIHRIYDLKGSWKGRRVRKSRVDEIIIFKDVDFGFRFHLDPLVRQRLLVQFKNDCELLEAEGVMDYSLLIVIALQDPDKGLAHSRKSYSRAVSSNSYDSPTSSVDSTNYSVSTRNMADSTTYSGSPTNSVDSINSSCQNSGFGWSSLPANSVNSRCSDSERISAYSLQDVEDTQSTSTDICKEPDSPIYKLGVKMPARAVRLQQSIGGSVSSATNAREEDVVLYFSIIDIFQTYTLGKRLQHAYKSIKYDAKSITAVNPKAYSSRFQDFLSQIFQVNERSRVDCTPHPLQVSTG